MIIAISFKASFSLLNISPITGEFGEFGDNTFFSLSSSLVVLYIS